MSDARAMTKREAIEVILSDTKRRQTSLNYAWRYCEASRGMTGTEFETQCIYILSNISGWRHPMAREVRTALRLKERGLR